MIKNIFAIPRQQVEYWIDKKKKPCSEKNWALMSIWGNHELLDLTTIKFLQDIKCREVISICFEDLSDEQVSRIHIIQPDQKFHLFNNLHARRIINFIDLVNKLDDIETLFIHCAAGISRSGATSLFACRYLGLDEEKFRKENINILPNFYVLSILNKESGTNSDYVQWWEESKKREREKLSKLTEIQFNRKLWG